jgi:hypothetical protein
MRRILGLAAFGLLLSFTAQAQTTATITGTIKDLTGSVVTSGQVTFDLQPSIDTTQSGTARFVPSTVTCGINGSGLVKNLALSGACTVTTNTSLVPANTSYRVCIWPANVKTSCFVTYITGDADITTASPTQGQMPAYTLVDVFSNQTVAGNKTFTGSTTFSGSTSFSGAISGSSTVTGSRVGAGDGLAATPGFYFTHASDGGTGFYHAPSTLNVFYEVANSIVQRAIIASEQRLKSSAVVTWSSGDPSASAGDTSLCRVSAGVVGVGTSSTCGVAGEIRALQLKLAGATTLTGQTGTGTSIVTNTGPTIASPTITTGVGADGSGFKHKRGSMCTTAAGANSTCNTTVTWGTTFADTSYTAVCFLENASVAGQYISHINSTKSAGSISIEMTNGPVGGAATGSYNCIAVHD